MKNRKPMHTGLRNELRRLGIPDPEASVSPYSLLSVSRIKGIVDSVLATNGLDGATAEIGCAAGGTSLVIGTINHGRKHWACDTFKGLVETSEIDTDLWIGQFSAATLTHAAVEQRLGHLPNVSVIEGFFPECAPAEMDTRYSFVHLDVDTYASMLNCWAWFRDRMLPGGIIAMDDVIGRGTIGGKQAFLEMDRRGYKVIAQNDPQVIVRFRG